jgi:hypothetical protein
MGWGGVDAVRMLAGETPEEAIAREYAGGCEIDWQPGGPVLNRIPGEPPDQSVISHDEREWMVRTLALLQEIHPGWLIVDSVYGDDPRWPRRLDLADPEAPMWISLSTGAATMRAPKFMPGAADDFAFWWRHAQRLAAAGCAIFEPDESEIIDTSLGVADAQARYCWM